MPHEARLVDLQGSWVVAVTPPASGEEFRVYVGDAMPDATRTPVLGDGSLAGGELVWTPRFPLSPGAQYRGVWTSAAGDVLGSTLLTVPAVESAASTRVLDVYPSTASIPENLLRVYIQFSGPMSRGSALEAVRLVDATGAPIEGAFVLPEEELWSPGQDRLTLLFDPGRLKQDVGPNLALGPPLRAGVTVTLEVAATWPDENGQPLMDGFRRTWAVVAADRTQPDSSQWTLRPPEQRASVLRLEFAAPLDRGLLRSMITVRTAAGNRVPGTVTIDAGERGWEFTPVAQWAASRYEVVIDADIEDPAGNSLERLFDEPLTDTVGRPALPDVVFEFQVR